MSTTKPPDWSRRQMLLAGSSAVAASIFDLSCGEGAGRDDSSAGPLFRTELCDLLQIDFPVLQAPMSRVATPAMVAAVSQAGGLGILAGIGLPADALRTQIQEVRQLTDRPFGVNLILHSELAPPTDASSIAETTLQAVQQVLNRFRRQLGIPENNTRPPSFPDLLEAAFEVIIEERVPVFSVGLGKPTDEMVRRCHAQGAKIIAMASTVPDAVELAEAGIDCIIAQGSDAGGHRSTWVKKASPERAAIGTLSLVPQVVDAVSQPVIAAGGIMNGRGLLASLALGASGVLMGTRFIATSESGAPEFYKQELILRDSDETSITDAFTGLYARVLDNEFVESYRASGAPVLPAGIQQIAATDITSASAQQQKGSHYPMYAGQGVGMIRDVPDSSSIVNAVIEEARQELAALSERVRLG